MRFWLSMIALFTATNVFAEGYDSATANACNANNAPQTPSSYYACCYAKCAGADKCAETCQQGADSLTQIQQLEQKRDQNRPIVMPKLELGQ